MNYRVVREERDGTHVRGNSHGVTPAFAWSDEGKPLKLPVRIVVQSVTTGIKSRKANHPISCSKVKAIHKQELSCNFLQLN
jgi:hypothetical protein